MSNRIKINGIKQTFKRGMSTKDIVNAEIHNEEVKARWGKGNNFNGQRLDHQGKPGKGRKFSHIQVIGRTKQVKWGMTYESGRPTKVIFHKSNPT